MQDTKATRDDGGTERRRGGDHDAREPMILAPRRRRMC
jgi:hypothetical protein